MITPDLVRKLAGFTGSGHPVVTVYLDVDGRRWPRLKECEARLERLVRKAAERAERAGVGPGALGDLRRIEAYVKAGIDRHRTRGLAIFASGPSLWEVLALPVRVRDQVVVNDHAAIGQLEAAVENHARLGALLVDRQRARVFVYELGDLVAQSELFEALPRHDDDAGGADRRHDRSHVEALARQHLKHAAAAAFDVYKTMPFDRFVLGAPDDVVTELEGLLHRYLSERIVGRINVAPNAPEADVRAALADAEHRAERAEEAALVERVRHGAASGRGAVAGLDAVLDALCDGRVAVLVVSDGFETEGWRCGPCARLARKGRRCPACGADMELVDDLVERAVEAALLGGARVEVVIDCADLDVVGRVGALLRY